MHQVIPVNPFKCRVWQLHDRLEHEITEETCRAEMESFREHGQLVPALGRRLCGDPKYEVELIYGARRLFVAQRLNKPLLVQLRELSDRDGIIAMDIENRLREDISPYERGLSYARWLRIGYFKSQDDIAVALGLSSSQVSRLLRLARLPAVVVQAFRSATDICENWGLDLMDALEDPAKRSATIRAARALSMSPRRPPSVEVYRRLLRSAIRGYKPNALKRDRVVLGEDGRPLFRVRYQNKSIVLILPTDKVSNKSLEEIEAVLNDILKAG
jgi:ParB family transcriptional regulator, chromosome partitioning protein